MTARPLRSRFLIGASIGALALAASAARAGSTAGSPFARTVDPAAQAARAAAAQAAEGANATAASQRALAAFAQAAAIRHSMDSAQAAARAAAAAAQAHVPNGLGVGGLQVDPGVAGDPSLWIGASAPTQSTGADGRTKVDVTQTQSKAILNWQSFNVGQTTDLTFSQGNASWVVLNRVNDPSANPSQILGTIKAPGTVLILNRNGVIFGGASQINTGALVASALNITDAQFLKGIVNQVGLDGTTSPPTLFAPTFGNDPSTKTGDVTVQAGAIIQTSAPKSVTVGGGFVYLLGGNVINGGEIITPDGQAVLAAGRQVYLTQSLDPSVRGVEVNLVGGGTVTNLANALVSAPTGNVTLIGHDVEQRGIALATTTVDEAGSINLLTYEGVDFGQDSNNKPYLVPVSTGTAKLATGSLTAILPEENGRTALNGQPQGQSVIRVEGETVEAAGGSTILAPSGKVSLQASSNAKILYANDHPSFGISTSPVPDESRVYVGDGALIDVSGLQNVAADASQDVVEISVRGNELRDSPLQRGGILQNENVYVNVHDLTTVASDRVYTTGGLLEVSGFLGLVPHNIDQRLTTGGSVSIGSSGDVILRPGASINIAGGSIAHQAGMVNQTLLLGSDGKVYDINDAPADLKYIQVGPGFTFDHARWGVSQTWSTLFDRSMRFQSAYTEGKNAGTFTIGATSAEVDAKVDATAINGVYQRGSGNMAHGGSLVAGSPGEIIISPTTPVPVDVFSGSTLIDGNRDPATLLPVTDQGNLHLSAEVIDSAGYGSIAISGAGIKVVDGASLDVTPGGKISLTAAFDENSDIDVDGTLIAHGGTVDLNTTFAQAQSANVSLSARSVIDVTGTWTNDLRTPSTNSPLLYDGGTVSIDARDGVRLARGSVIDASGGGWMQASGALKTDAHGLALGTGGNISVITNEGRQSNTVGVPTDYPGELVLDGTLRSNGLHGGGRLSLVAPSIRIGGADSHDGKTLWIDPTALSNGGFGGYRLISYGNLDVMPGTDISLHARTLTPSGFLVGAATGSDIVSNLALGTPAAYQQAAPVNLTLAADDPFAGTLTIGAGARIIADPGATIGVHASRQLTIDGEIEALGGTINLDLVSLPQAYANMPLPDYDPTETLWIGSTARLSVAGLVQTFTDALGAPMYRLWNGGSVSINRNATNADYYPTPSFFPPPPDPGVPNAAPYIPPSPVGTIVGQAGSIIDVSGAAGMISVPTGAGPYRGTTSIAAATAGGTLDIIASQGLLLDSTLKAAGGSASTAGGRLSIDQTVWVNGVPGYVEPVGEMILTQHGTSISRGLAVGEAVPADLQGQMHVSADQIMQAGYDDVSLGAQNAVLFDGDVDLHVQRSLTLNVRDVGATSGANVTLAASYIDIGGARRPNSPTADIFNVGGPEIGTAKLAINANLIDLDGGFTSGASYVYASLTPDGLSTLTLPGFASIAFNSAGDIRLATSENGANVLATLGDLTFTSSQLYPVTTAPAAVNFQTNPNALYEIAASGADSVITIAKNGAPTPLTPYSAGGQVQFVAPTINQGGVVRAPIGQITFGDPNAPAEAINFLPGSITSVSANGLLIPYGGPLSNTEYGYGYGFTAPPQKVISIYGQSVVVAGAGGGRAAAKIDESGGGDLSGVQFVSGTGGSIDTLNGTETFAIVPSLGTSYAPRSTLLDSSDPTKSSAASVDLKVGDEVYLSGIAGLAAGYYTLLPGHYALLPGGYKLTVSATNLAPSQVGPNQMLPSGAFEISGYRATLNTAIRDPLSSEFIVTPGAVVRQQSQYLETTVTKFFQAQAALAGNSAPPLPIDAGQLVLDAVTSLDFHGQGDFSVGSGGRGGKADIVGNQLEVLGAGDTATDGYIGVSDTLVSDIGAQSVLIGGVRSTSFDGKSITLSNEASDVEIGAHAVLDAPEILLRATNSLSIDPGAVIDTTNAGAIADTFTVDPATGRSTGSINVNGGAFLIASNATTPVPVVITAIGDNSTLSIGAGSRIETKGGLSLANTANFSVADTAVIATPTLSIAAPVINLGGTGVSGVDLTSALLATLMRGDTARGVAPTTALSLDAGQALNVYGSTSFGGDAAMPRVDELTLRTPLIQGFGVSDDMATIAAKSITLNGAAASGPTGNARAGTLAFDAGTLTLGAGQLAFGGFSTVSFNASGQIVGSGSGTYTMPGDLDVSTPLLTGTAGADTILKAAGAAIFATPTASTTHAAIQSVGAHLTVDATSIVQDTNISLPSGVVTLNGTSGVTLGSASVTDVSGAVTPFFDVVRIAPGGTVALAAATGDVAIDTGAVVDLNGGDLASLDRTKNPNIDPLASDLGGDAGSLTIFAKNGTTTLDGTIETKTVAGYRGAQATIAVLSGDTSALLDGIADFSGKQALSLASGDIIVHDITARDVELSTGTGNVTVMGTIDADAPTGGIVRLAAGHDLTLAGGAVIDARATSSDGDPGSVFLGVDGRGTGQLTLAAGSLIDVSGAGPNGGRIWLRAPRVGQTAVALVDGGTRITGAREIDAEAVAVTDISNDPYVDQNLGAAVAAADAYMANARAITSGIGALATNASFHLMPGIELDGTGDLSLLAAPSSTNTGIDLHTDRFDGEPMVLTVRAAGNFTMNGSLSDGFEAPVASPDGNIFTLAALLPNGTRSATLRLTAGADLGSADPDALIAKSALTPDSGSLLFNDPHNDSSSVPSALGTSFPIASVLRTGTGDLEISAAGDINLETPFGIYTAGYESAAIPGFSMPTRQLADSADCFGSCDFPTDSYLGYDPNTSMPYDAIYPIDFHPSYPEHGGNFRLVAQGNLTSANVADVAGLNNAYAGTEPTSYWLWTSGTLTGNGIVDGTAYINFGTYYQDYSGFSFTGPQNFFDGYDAPPGIAAFRGVGALGGGAVAVSVGGDLSNVDVAAPTTARTPAGATSLTQVVTTGGGNLSLLAGGALNNANIDIGRGEGYIRAANIGTQQVSGVVDLSVGDAQLTALSDGDLNILIGDQTRWTPQYLTEGRNGFGPAGLEEATISGPSVYGFFTSYTDRTAFSVHALGGDVTLAGDFAPSHVESVADAGSVTIDLHGLDSIYMMPSSNSQLDILAGNGVNSGAAGEGNSVGGFSMTGLVPSLTAQIPTYRYVDTILNLTANQDSLVPSNLLQTDDPRTNHVYAVTGDIYALTLISPKRTDIQAGHDIVAPLVQIQNNLPTDISEVRAGNDLYSCTSVARCLGFTIQVSGPGGLDVLAGRNIDIESPASAGPPSAPVTGISSIGNLYNPLLPVDGASLNIAAGIGANGPDIANFISTYVNPAGSAGVIANYAGALVAYMDAREGKASLSIDEALADFRTLGTAQQLPFVEQVYFAELKAGGRAAAAGEGAGGKGYDRAYKAIETLFPGSTPGTPTTAYHGDLTVTQLAAIRTQAGGNINLLVPGGSVTLGVQSETPDLTGQTDTARPGILTLRGGDINLFADRDLIVAQSRVFTELGGDILMFSDDGDLNAGKGKQTSLVTSPAQFTLDPYGHVTKSPVTPQTGAGIATLVGVPGVPPGDVDLFAPHGTIDAGDAGIRVSGDLHIAALHIVNAQNIQVQGQSTGIPQTVAVNTAALAAASNTASAVSSEAEQLAKRATPDTSPRDVPYIITGTFLGFGE